ncbi:MAG: tryptophan synthase subunit alpha [Coriobacteriia bacterium]
MSETITRSRLLGTAPSGLACAFGNGCPALIGYVMGGYPDRRASLEALRVLAEAGVDLIELGVPYADPLADGPVIGDAANVARQASPGGFGLAETIDLAGEFLARARGSAPPVALMTYLNPVLRLGMADAASAMRGAGISGIIIPDLPPEMAASWLAASQGIDTVFLAAPTSTPERLAKIGAASKGFVYCVSTTGVTGERSELPMELTGYIARVRAATTLPVAVGFGVSTAQQAADVAKIADGVVVGSAIVRRQGDAAALRRFVQELVCAVR